MKLKLILILFSLIIYKSGDAQLMTLLRGPSPERKLKTFNPFTCTFIDSFPLSDSRSKYREITSIGYVGDSLYMIGVFSMIMRYNPQIGMNDSIFQLPESGAYGMASDGKDILYIIFGNKHKFYKYSLEDKSYTSNDYDINVDLTGKFTYFRGRIFGGTGLGLIEISPEDGRLLATYAAVPDSIKWFGDIAANHYNCEEYSFIVYGKRDTWDEMTWIYEFFPSTGELKFLCKTDEEYIWSITELPVEYDCTLLVDSDKDNSGGLLPIHYQQEGLCGRGRSPVTDRDPYVYSTVGKIDSIVAQLASPLPDGSQEYLDLGIDATYTIRGSGSDRIVIESESFEGYELALRRLEYVNDALNPTVGGREVWLTAHRLERVSDTSRCKIPILAPARAGQDMDMEFCISTETLDLSPLLSSEAEADGYWSPGSVARMDLIGDNTYLYIVDREGCPSDTATFTIKIWEQPSMQLDANLVICDGKPTTLNPQGAEFPELMYNWSTGEKSRTIVVDESGIYQLTVSNGFCTQELQQEIIYVPEILSGLPERISLCSAEAQLEVVANPDYIYLWSTGERTSEISVNQSGQYTVEISREDCRITDTILVELYQFPMELSLGSDRTSCGEPVLLTLEDLPSGGQYIWQDGQMGSGYLATHSGIYHVTATYGPCVQSDTIQITIDVLPELDLGPDQTICDTIQLILSAGQDWDSYYWTSGESTSEISVTQSGQYGIRVIKGDCEVEDSIRIQVRRCLNCPIFIPTAVTPNRDGLNDKLELYSMCQIEIREWKLYDRWGSEVYSGTDNNPDWPNSRTSEGVYISMLKYIDPEDGQIRILAGEVAVLR
jgi:hypothetical protein